MSKKGKKKKRPVLALPSPAPARATAPPCPPHAHADYDRAAALAEAGDLAAARQAYESLKPAGDDPARAALIRNDLGVLAAVAEDYETARVCLREALTLDPGCAAARANLALLQQGDPPSPEPQPSSAANVPPPGPSSRTRVAVLSFLFNWPTTGGGNVHTAELVRFLGRAGYDVRHFYPRYTPWGVGGVEDAYPGEALEFGAADWNVTSIRTRFRAAVDAFRPDWVLIQDAWNFKPHLAEAVRGYPVLLRFQALECLCPLNNVRLLLGTQGYFSQCPRQQLATPEACHACLQQRGHLSGGLHQAERALSGVGTPGYHELLCRSLQEAEAVLVLNPFTEAMLSPHARRVEVVPWGMDPARFPWPPPERERSVPRIFLAALVHEAMKGFDVLHEACARLWRTRRDFELVVTGDPPGRQDEFTHFTGWVSQGELSRHYWETDITVVPTIAQEGLSRTSVEAMAAGKPVVASRIGGLPFTVADGATGLLCMPGDPDDLAEKLAALLDDDGLRRRMGLAGRRRFEEAFIWDAVIEKHYRPLLAKR